MFKKFIQAIAALVAFVFIFSIPLYQASAEYGGNGHKEDHGHFSQEKQNREDVTHEKQGHEEATHEKQDHEKASHEKQDHGKADHEKQDHGKANHAKQHVNKGQLKRVDSISKRLDSIEAEINSITEEATAYFNGQTTTGDTVQTTTGDTVQTSTPTAVVAQSDSQENLADESVFTVTSDTIEVNTELNDEIQNTEDTESELEDTVAQQGDEQYFSFFGKLGAQLNKLNAVKKQIYHLQREGVDATVLASLSSRVDDLENLALTELKNIVDFASGTTAGTTDGTGTTTGTTSGTSTSTSGASVTSPAQ